MPVIKLIAAVLFLLFLAWWILPLWPGLEQLPTALKWTYAWVSDDYMFAHAIHMLSIIPAALICGGLAALPQRD